MPFFEFNNLKINIDDEGFLTNPSDWTEDLARAIAKVEDVDELTENHFKVIYYLREYFSRFGVAPGLAKICKDTGFKLYEIYTLFPSGPAKGACKIAGLTIPAGCV